MRFTIISATFLALIACGSVEAGEHGLRDLKKGANDLPPPKGKPVCKETSCAQVATCTIDAGKTQKTADNKCQLYRKTDGRRICAEPDSFYTEKDGAPIPSSRCFLYQTTDP
jgi:hypothetical protein